MHPPWRYASSRPESRGCTPGFPPPQAAQRGQKQAPTTEPDADDPLASHYGDTELVQSVAQTGRTWTDVGALTPELAGQAVLVRARVHTVRGKGKSAFLVLRQATATVQATLFVDDVNVSKGMVKYASAIPRESIVDVEGQVVATKEPIEACSQSQVGAPRLEGCLCTGLAQLLYCLRLVSQGKPCCKPAFLPLSTFCPAFTPRRWSCL